MNKKGQALIEFILIMPVFMIIIMSLIDVGNIFIKKDELNKSIETIHELYQNNETEKLVLYTTKENITLEENIKDNLVDIKISKKIKINAPILTNILGKEYKIETTKTFYIEEQNNG